MGKEVFTSGGGWLCTYLWRDPERMVKMNLKKALQVDNGEKAPREGGTACAKTPWKGPACWVWGMAKPEEGWGVAFMEACREGFECQASWFRPWAAHGD